MNDSDSDDEQLDMAYREKRERHTRGLDAPSLDEIYDDAIAKLTALPMVLCLPDTPVAARPSPHSACVGAFRPRAAAGHVAGPTDILDQHRDQCVGYLFGMRDVMRALHCSTRSVHTAVSIVDRFVHLSTGLRKNDLEAVCGGALSLSIKMDVLFDDTYAPTVIASHSDPRSCVEPAHVLLWETRILKGLDFNLGYLTLFPMAPEEALKHLGGSPTRRFLASLFLDMSLCALGLASTDKRVLLAGSLLLARFCVRRRRKPSLGDRRHHTHILEYHAANIACERMYVETDATYGMPLSQRRPWTVESPSPSLVSWTLSPVSPVDAALVRWRISNALMLAFFLGFLWLMVFRWRS